MATEVLLMATVPDLGTEGDVVTVHNGYARNYLLPRKLAAPVTAGMRRHLAKLVQTRDAARKQELQGAQELANRLANAACSIPMKASSDKKLYGSVTVADIVAALQAQDLTVDKSQILLDAPIKQLGIFPVPVRLHSEVQTTVKVWVVEE